MFVEIRNNVNEEVFEDFSGGDLICSENEAFIVLNKEIHNSSTRQVFNAVNLETGEPVYFTPKNKIIFPNYHTLTVEL